MRTRCPDYPERRVRHGDVAQPGECRAGCRGTRGDGALQLECKRRHERTGDFGIRPVLASAGGSQPHDNLAPYLTLHF